MSTINFAWKASPQFTEALRTRQAEREQWFEDVVGSWNDAHPNQSLYGSNGSALTFDLVVDGFADGDRKSPVPVGLSRATSRAYLKPARGAAGAPWREALETFTNCPSLDEVFQDHGAAVYVLADHSLCRANLFDTGDAMFIYSSADLSLKRPSEHLTAVKLSEFYAAKEAMVSA